jgi:formyl-CoA transferase
VNQAVLDRLITEWTSTRTAAELEALLERHGVPNGRIFTAPDMLADAHFAARSAIVRLQHPVLGEFPMQNVTPRLGDTPGEVRWVGPELGEHTDEVLGDRLGLTGEDLVRLRARAII